MNPETLEKIAPITEEEKAVLLGDHMVDRNIYSTQKAKFIIDSKLMLAEQSLIGVRPHTRFIRFPAHRHNYIEMVYMCSGSTTHIINETQMIHLEEGDILFLNQNSLQEVLPAGKNDIAVNFLILPIFFDMVFPLIKSKSLIHNFIRGSLERNGSGIDYLHFKTKKNRSVHNLAENLILSLCDGKAVSDHLNQMTMSLLILHLEEQCECINWNNPEQNEVDLVLTIIHHIQKNYHTVSLSSLCKITKQPDYYICRLLKKHTGSTFKSLVQNCRLDQAVALLTSTSLPINDIITLVGYSNASYFYTIFRKKYHISPAEYRTQSLHCPS